MNAIKTLLVKRLRNELTPQEADQLQQWIAKNANNRALYDRLGDDEAVTSLLAKMDEFDEKKGWDYVRKHADKVDVDEQKVRVHPVHFLKTAWFKYAAAVLVLIIGIATYFFIHTSQSQVEVAQTTPSPLPKEDVLPGSDKAILTLSNGQQVQLNNATSETIKDGTLSIENRNGVLTYEIPYSSASPRLRDDGGVAINTMSTPKGGQYKLTLSDGTQVWLNAASSITYPIAFTAKTREVSITGEAYFEVAKNKEKPFIVKTIKEEITVLGTQFNVNAYADEPSIKTSLLEGSVRISPAGAANAGTASGTLSPAGGSTPSEARGEGGSRSEQQSRNGIILKPGEAYTNGKIIKTDLDQDIAWKKGIFNFHGRNVEQVMRQLSRWYDIEVSYESTPPAIVFYGEMGRNLTLSKVLEFLEKSGIHFRVDEGNKLKVLK